MGVVMLALTNAAYLGVPQLMGRAIDEIKGTVQSVDAPNLRFVIDAFADGDFHQVRVALLIEATAVEPEGEGVRVRMARAGLHDALRPG